jgi:hypothetical protein
MKKIRLDSVEEYAMDKDVYRRPNHIIILLFQEKGVILSRKREASRLCRQDSL